MNCPNCQADTRVTDTRIRPPGQWRRRECLTCGHRFSTQEKIVQPKGQIGQLTKPKKPAKWVRDTDGEGFESWLTVIATTLSPHEAANVNLRKLRYCFELGMKLEQAMELVTNE